MANRKGSNLILRVLGTTMVGFVLGSLPFSVWLGKLRGKNVRLVGDGNPGAANAFKAGGWRIGLPALLLDFLKAAVPVGAGRWVLGIDGWWLVPVFLAPIAGHAFSPFLGFHGGKAVAATFGAWCGMTLWQGPSVLGLGLGLAWLVVAPDAWCVVLGMVGLAGWLFFRGAGAHVFAAWLGNLAVIVVKHWPELAVWPRLRWRRAG